MKQTLYSTMNILVVTKTLPLKQFRKLRWSVAFVILQNCDLLTYSVSNISSPRSVCCEAATDKKVTQ